MKKKKKKEKKGNQFQEKKEDPVHQTPRNFDRGVKFKQQQNKHAKTQFQRKSFSGGR